MEYKGFEIKMVPACEIAPVTYEVFGKNYATESAAKVAITKYLKQQEQAEQKLSNPPSVGNPEEFIDWLEESVNTINKIAERVYSTSVQQSRNKREGFFSGLYNGSVKRLPIDTYHDGAKYVWSSSDEPKNRKQRKIMKIYQKRNKALFNYLQEFEGWI